MLLILFLITAIWLIWYTLRQPVYQCLYCGHAVLGSTCMGCYLRYKRRGDKMYLVGSLADPKLDLRAYPEHPLHGEWLAHASNRTRTS
jgi:hypothetical protein